MSTTNEPATHVPVMVNGTDNNADYLLLAVRGPVALAVKPLVVIGNGKGQAYVGAKLRSMKASEVPAALVPLPKVLSLPDAKATLEAAWGNIEWEKKKPDYCSAPVGTWIKGDAASPELLVKNLREVVPGNMTDFLWGLCSKHAVLAQDQLLAFVTQKYEQVAHDIEASVAADKAIAEMAESKNGVFGFQTSLLKKMAQKGKDG